VFSIPTSTRSFKQKSTSTFLQTVSRPFPTCPVSHTCERSSKKTSAGDRSPLEDSLIRSPRDDVYNGYLIRKDSLVHPVQWSIHRDKTLYPDAESFIPERWLEPQYPTYREPLTSYPNLQNYSGFGFGRRICQGQNLAERSLYIEAAVIAWACNISEKPGTKPQSYDYIAGFNTRPKWFDFELTAREGRDKLVNVEFERVWGERVKGS
jgi:Cytochrome P450